MLGSTEHHLAQNGFALTTHSNFPNDPIALATRENSQSYDDSKPHRGRPWCAHS